MYFIDIVIITIWLIFVCIFIFDDFVFIILNYHFNVSIKINLIAIHVKRVIIQIKNMQLMREWMKRWNILNISNFLKNFIIIIDRIFKFENKNFELIKSNSKSQFENNKFESKKSKSNASNFSIFNQTNFISQLMFETQNSKKNNAIWKYCIWRNCTSLMYLKFNFNVSNMQIF